MREPHSSSCAQLASVDRLLNSAALGSSIEQYGRETVKHAVRAILDGLRQTLRRGETTDTDQSTIVAATIAALEHNRSQRLRRVINLTGTVLHTNLGRAVLPRAAVEAVVDAASSPTNLEFDLETGQRGDRDSHIEAEICRLTGAAAATVVNNNAAAVMLVLNSLALNREVIVSRGELVEIGGSFRIPDIITRAGCQLREVGTTNRTHLHDFEHAMSSETALLMKVHQSNYVIEGFTASVDESALAELGHRASIPLVVDLGSGTLVDLEHYGLPHEATPMDALGQGADLVTFSGDKLLGGPQAGFIVGRPDLIDVIKANPMKRALRCDKMTIAALWSVLRLYTRPDTLKEALPGLRQMTRSVDELQARAQRLQPRMAERFGDDADIDIAQCESEIGSGALPGRGIPSVGITVRPTRAGSEAGLSLSTIAARFRQLPVPVIGRITRGTFLLDLRCLDDEQEFADQLVALNST